MQMKAVMRYHDTSIRMTKTKHWQYQVLSRVQLEQDSHTLVMGLKNGVATQENDVTVSYKLNLHFV